jgi:glycosyl hydrolase family 25
LAGLTRRVDGIDVYESNDVNWPGVADLNVSIGLAKAWHETDAQDRKFRTFWPAMRHAGLIRGAYLLLKPELDNNRAGIEALVQHFTDRIDDVGGLEPGDLPPILDYEGDLPPGPNTAAKRRKALDQLAWALNKLTPYTQRAMHDPDALPMLYTGSSIWVDALGDPDAAFVTSDAADADKIHIDFSTFPLWWSYVHAEFESPKGSGNWIILDPLKATDLAKMLYPKKAWPGPRHILLQYSGHVPFPAGQGGQADHDGDVIADVDAARKLTTVNDFSPLLKLAMVAPPTTDIELSRVAELSEQPPDQVFSLLLLGQGFWPDEFADVVRQGLFGLFNVPGTLHSLPQTNVHVRDGLADIAPLNLLFKGGGKNMLACYYDACTHADGTGLHLPLREEAAGLIDQADPAGNNLDYAVLRIGHQALDPPQARPAGATVADYLARLKITLANGQVHRATEYCPLRERRTGPTGSLVAVLRKGQVVTQYGNKPTIDASPAEYYHLDPDTDETVPFVAVNVIPGGDWPLVLARAIAQNLAGLADEYELAGDAFARPPDSVISPLAPNVLAISADDRTALVNGTGADKVIPQAFGLWGIPAAPLDFVAHTAPTPNPIAPWNAGVPPYDVSAAHLVEGGGGFRTQVVRCNRDCLMRRIPAATAMGIVSPKPPALPIQSTLRAFCQACQMRLRAVITGRNDFHVEARVDIDSERRLFDWIQWTDRKALPATTAQLATGVVTNQPVWTCTAEFAAPAGFRFTDIKLVNVDYWAPGMPQRIANVLKSVGFDLAVEFANATVKPLSIPAALAAAKPAPRFEAAIAGDKTGKYQIGAGLSLSWSTTDPAGKPLTVDAQLSLVLAGLSNDLDPAGAMVGCRLYPQIAMRVRNGAGAASVKSLRGSIALVANNADPSNLTGTLKAIARGQLTTSLFCESNRATWDARKRAAQRIPDAFPQTQALHPLPQWSFIYDYANADVRGAVKFTGAYSRADGAKGTSSRDFAKAWPSGQNVTSATIHKLARQGVYDSLCIHPDRGKDATGHGIVAAPICADLGLQLHWRRGIAWTSGPLPAHVFRGWGAGRLDQGARTVVGPPCVPPNQHVDVEVTPAADRSSVAVKYSVTATEVSPPRWHVFLEQGLEFAFQYATGAGLPNTWTPGHLGWVEGAVGVGPVAADDILKLFGFVGDADKFDAKVRDMWSSISKHLRFFDTTADASSEQQIPDGPSDAAHLENL